MRLAPPDRDGDPTGQVELQNRQGEKIAASALVSMDFSCLPRLELRSANDPRVLAMIRVVDHLLRAQKPLGPPYHRYNNDGFGEHAYRSPYGGCGVRRLSLILGAPASTRWSGQASCCLLILPAASAVQAHPFRSSIAPGG